MRNEEQIMKLIIDAGKSDPNIRAMALFGSRALESYPIDIYQDYDVCCYVDDVKPYFNNISWLEAHFGKILIVQMPDLNDNPDLKKEDADKFTYLAIYEDGCRIDLTFTSVMPSKESDGEPFTVLLDKCGVFDGVGSNQDIWNVRVPSQKEFSSCCNEFWWCLNNVAKGIARNQIPYAKAVFEMNVRSELNKMVSWYIGTITDFSVSSGKLGKYFKKYLPDSVYERYLKTYSTGDCAKMWISVINTCKLFSDLARLVASDLGLQYNGSEEDGARLYIMNVKSRSRF